MVREGPWHHPAAGRVSSIVVVVMIVVVDVVAMVMVVVRIVALAVLAVVVLVVLIASRLLARIGIHGGRLAGLGSAVGQGTRGR